MKTYKVTAMMHIEVVCEIQADDLDDAWGIARGIDSEDFRESGSGYWDITDVHEVTE
jgi:hypothetical protein